MSRIANRVSRACAIESLEARSLRSATPVMGGGDGGTPSLPGVSAPTPVASTFTSAAPTTALAGRAYSYTVDTDDANGDPRVLTAPTLPTWLTFTDNGDGTATLAGTPAAADTGSAPVQLAVNDGTYTTNQDFTITVAAPASAVLDNGQLTVHGTDDADAIHVWTPAARPNIVRVAMNGQLWNFDIGNVSGVAVYGENGDDTITANPNFGVFVYGGDGNDSITGSDFADELAGGQGNDTLLGMGGDDLLSGHGGDDRLDGGAGNDRLYGNAGRDRLFGGTGQNYLEGGAGRDLLLSQNPNGDTLTGDADDDIAATDAEVATGIASLLA